MITVRNLRKTLGGKTILSKVNFSLGKGQKVALVGPNGVGKSTLLKILAGIDTQDRGEIEKPKKLLIGYLPQEPELPKNASTIVEFLRETTGMAEMEWRMKLLESRLENEEALLEYDRLLDASRRIAQFSFEDRARRMMDGLFLKHIALDRNFETLSGGEKAKVNLVSVLLRGADMLLLDEPTNNLDLPALIFLERYLAGSNATILVASHDRAFLDAIVTKVLAIDWFTRSVEMWKGNWTEYFRLSEEKKLFEKESYKKEQKEKIRLKESSNEKKEWARIGGAMIMPDRDKMSQGYHRNRSEQKFGAQAIALETRSEKAEKTKLAPERDPFQLFFGIREAGDAERLALEKMVAGYPVPEGVGAEDAFRIGPIDMEIRYGSRIAFLGLNGSGKSTVMKVIAGVLEPESGTVIRGEKIHIGDLMQAHENIPRKKTAYEWFLDETHFEKNGEVGLFLREFQFDPEPLEAPLGRLSPGERARLSIAMMVAKGVNTLLLDEPTNHLDLEAIASLEDALEKYPGTVILVSHDRAFLERTRIDGAYLFEKNAVHPIENREEYILELQSRAEKEATGLLRRIEKL